MTKYAIEVYSHDTREWHTAPAPLEEFMSIQLVNADLWFPLTTTRVVPVTVNAR